MASKRKPRTIAPRLADGRKRESCGHGLPPHIKQALKMRAYSNNMSLSWMLEQALVEFFRMRKPEYKGEKR